MTSDEFWEKTQAHPEIEIVGKRDGKILVRHHKTKSLWLVEPSEVERNEWSRLEEIFVGRQSPEIISYFARIVGYYSELKPSKINGPRNQWNVSKIQEWRDRRRGNYSIPQA